MINPNEIIEYNAERMALKDIPDAAVRHSLGLGHFPVPGRGVLPNPSGEPWPYTPEMCLRTDETRWTWIDGGRYLVCPGCGVDGT